MAVTSNSFTGDGSTTNYSFTFEYLEQAEVKVTLDGVATTAFTFANATTLSFTSAPGNGVAIYIYRDTNIDTLKATFFPGSAIKAEDLNDNFTQNNFAAQESKVLAAQAPTALTNSLTAISTANAASADAAAALAAVNLVVSAQAVSSVAALAILDTSGLSAQDQATVFDSTGIENYNTTYPSAPQITGLPAGLVGASDLSVRLIWSGSGWTFSSYSPDDPDNRYYTQSVADSTFVTQASIGTTVQAYDADTAKLDVAQTFTAQQTFGELKETVYTLGTTGTIDLDPANGSIQSSVLTGAPTFTDALEAGQVIVLMLEGGASNAVTWPTITWVTSVGNVAPALTAKDTLVLWKVSTTLYGAYVGSYV